MGKYSAAQISSAIKNKYGTQKGFAEILGISEQALSKRINRGSQAFVKKLKDMGVEIGNDDKDELIVYLSEQLKQKDQKITELEQENQVLRVRHDQIDNAGKKNLKE